MLRYSKRSYLSTLNSFIPNRFRNYSREKINVLCPYTKDEFIHTYILKMAKACLSFYFLFIIKLICDEDSDLIK